jgi:hypothetical protein
VLSFLPCVYRRRQGNGTPVKAYKDYFYLIFMDWKVMIPTGEIFDRYESNEIGEYRHFADANPLFDKGLDAYLHEKLGPDWLSILRAEHKALSHVKDNAIKSVDACHEISFKGRDNGSYVFESDSFYDCPNDPGSIRKTIKIAQVGSVIKEEHGDIPEEPTLSGFARLGKWMYKNL